jgi:hypothetical protein
MGTSLSAGTSAVAGGDYASGSASAVASVSDFYNSAYMSAWCDGENGNYSSSVSHNNGDWSGCVGSGFNDDWIASAWTSGSYDSWDPCEDWGEEEVDPGDGLVYVVFSVNAEAYSNTDSSEGSVLSEASVSASYSCNFYPN